MHEAAPDVLKNNNREINLLSLESDGTGELHDSREQSSVSYPAHGIKFKLIDIGRGGKSHSSIMLQVLYSLP
jgi:hypothetical protein